MHVYNFELCAVLETIYTQYKEGYWEIPYRRGVSTANINLKEVRNQNWIFQRDGVGDGLNQKIICENGMDISWKNAFK